MTTCNMVLYINWSKCDGCGKCVEVCPENVFELKEFSQADIKKWHEKLNLIVRGSIRARVINSCSILYFGLPLHLLLRICVKIIANQRNAS